MQPHKGKGPERSKPRAFLRRINLEEDRSGDFRGRYTVGVSTSQASNCACVIHPLLSAVRR
jgi:hypothetical protein